MHYGKLHANKTLIDKHLYGLTGRCCKLSFSNVRRQTSYPVYEQQFCWSRCLSYAQWSTEILREAHLHGDWCSKQSVYKHQSGGQNEARTGHNLHQWVCLHVMHSPNSCFWSLNWSSVFSSAAHYDTTSGKFVNRSHVDCCVWHNQ